MQTSPFTLGCPGVAPCAGVENGYGTRDSFKTYVTFNVLVSLLCALVSLLCNKLCCNSIVRIKTT